jgi:hypothetical protein
MKLTVYVPDDLADLMKDQDDLNVSAVCQAALRRELTQREELAKLDKGMKRVVVYLETLDGHECGRDVAFTGKELYYNNGRAPELTAYLTKGHRIAIHDNNAQDLCYFESFDDLASTEANEVWQFGEGALLVAGVAEALGEKHVIELDI